VLIQVYYDVPVQVYCDAMEQVYFAAPGQVFSVSRLCVGNRTGSRYAENRAAICSHRNITRGRGLGLVAPERIMTFPVYDGA